MHRVRQGLHHQTSVGHTISQAVTMDLSLPVKANHVTSASPELPVSSYMSDRLLVEVVVVDPYQSHQMFPKQATKLAMRKELRTRFFHLKELSLACYLLWKECVLFIWFSELLLEKRIGDG